MEEKELFMYGDKELNVNSLLNNIDSNQQSYLNYYSNNISDSKAFIEKINYIKEGIKNGTITTDGTGVYKDANGKFSKDDTLMNNALYYVDVIAKEQSKGTRSLTKSEITQQEEEKKRKQLELQQKREEERRQQQTKPDFEPQEGWNVAKAFAHSFNQNGEIPYEILQQLVTVDDEGNPVYTDLYAQLDKNFDKVSEQLKYFNNTNSYIDNINLFKQALKDGDLSPQEMLLGMELGFQSSELDKLNSLIKYKTQPVKEIVEEPEFQLEYNQEFGSEIPELKQNPLESNLSFEIKKQYSKSFNEWQRAVPNQYVNYDSFTPAKNLKKDSEEEFRNYLKEYIRSYISSSKDDYLTREESYSVPVGGFYSRRSSIRVPRHDITDETLKYINPKLYNELGLKYFSNYSASNMYKYFKNLVDQQNKEKTINSHKEGGIIKAENGTKTSWRNNYNGTSYLMEDIYANFIQNISKYDAQKIANSLNKLNSDDFKSLNFGGDDNTTGFKSWNDIFNESGLNELFGYNKSISDYLGVTTRSRNDFVNYLKTKGNISTGTGDLSWDSESNTWNYTSNEVEPEVKAGAEAEIETEVKTGSETEIKAPDVAELSLKELDLKKPLDLNPNGIVNSLVGYIANETANAKKQEIQKELPLYQEIMHPEKAFKTAYTYDLENAKRELMAEANNIQPVTSDVSAYYDAKNNAIKNARAYANKLDIEINDRIHQTVSDNHDIAYDNAVNRTDTANTNAKYRHDWEIEQKQGEINLVDAKNESFQNLNNEIKNNIVTEARKKQKQRDAYLNKHILTGLMASPSNYIDNWTKHHDEIWYKGQNGQLETTQEQTEYQQLLSVVNQAATNIFAQYEGVKYPELGTLYTNSDLEKYDPSKHDGIITYAKGGKIDKQKINNFINKLK